MAKTAVITGITGQDGAYLSRLLLSKGYQVVGLIRPGVKENLFGLDYLRVRDKVTISECNQLDLAQVERMLKEFEPSQVYNLAAQSSVAVSFQHPHETIEFNILSVTNLLEAIKRVDKGIRFYQASSSDMFGNIDRLPVSEKSIIHPTSPYAISKVTGHWLTINYRESYGVQACCGVLFNHESYLRGPGFFVKKVIRTALQIRAGKATDLRVGDIDLKRDFGYAPDYVEAMWLMLEQKQLGEYLICSGQSVSLRDIIHHVFERLGIARDKIRIDQALFRPNDIRNIFGDNQKAKSQLGWKYEKNVFDVLDILLKEEQDALDETELAG